jgi:hypothetical protein
MSTSKSFVSAGSASAGSENYNNKKSTMIDHISTITAGFDSVIERETQQNMITPILGPSDRVSNRYREEVLSP